jgi:hypothetical protein
LACKLLHCHWRTQNHCHSWSPLLDYQVAEYICWYIYNPKVSSANFFGLICFRPRHCLNSRPSREICAWNYIYNNNNSNNKILMKTIIIVIIIKIIFYPFISLISNFAEICPWAFSPVYREFSWILVCLPQELLPEFRDQKQDFQVSLAPTGPNFTEKYVPIQSTITAWMVTDILYKKSADPWRQQGERVGEEGTS